MKRLLWLPALFGLFLVVGLVYLKGKRYEVVLTQETIDTALSKKFPETRTYLMLLSVTYSNPQVTLLEESNRVRVGLDADLNIRINDNPKSIGGGVTIVSGIRYEGDTQEFFLDDAVIERLEISGIPPQWLDRATEFITRSAKEYIEQQAVYQIQAKDVKTTAAKLLLKDFAVQEQEIHLSLGL